MHDGIFGIVGFIKKRKWGLAFCVWYWVFQPKPHDQYLFPYIGETPISRKVKEFNHVDDIYEEVAEISNESDGKRTIGQELWYLIPLFANPQYLLDDESFNLINEYHYIIDYHIPLGRTLDETDAHKLEYFTIIKNEMGVALRHRQEKDDKKR